MYEFSLVNQFMYPIINPLNIHGGITMCKALCEGLFKSISQSQGGNPVQSLIILPAPASLTRTYLFPLLTLLLPSPFYVLSCLGQGWAWEGHGGRSLGSLTVIGSMKTSCFCLCHLCGLQRELEYLPPSVCCSHLGFSFRLLLRCYLTDFRPDLGVSNSGLSQE